MPELTRGNAGGHTLPNKIAGNYYDLTTLIATQATGTVAVTANRVHLEPALLPAGIINLLSLGVTVGSASSHMRLGLYADPIVGGTFGAPLVDSGDIDTSGTGALTSGALSYAHPGGIIWLALLPSASITVTSYGLTSQTMPLGQAAANGLTRYGGVYYSNGSYGALPSNFTFTAYYTSSFPQIQARLV